MQVEIRGSRAHRCLCDVDDQPFLNVVGLIVPASRPCSVGNSRSRSATSSQSTNRSDCSPMGSTIVRPSRATSGSRNCSQTVLANARRSLASAPCRSVPRVGQCRRSEPDRVSYTLALSPLAKSQRSPVSDRLSSPDSPRAHRELAAVARNCSIRRSTRGVIDRRPRGAGRGLRAPLEDLGDRRKERAFVDATDDPDLIEQPNGEVPFRSRDEVGRVRQERDGQDAVIARPGIDVGRDRSESVSRALASGAAVPISSTAPRSAASSRSRVSGAVTAPIVT